MRGGIGMSLLQKMGWKQGEGLGKDNKGSLEPLALSVKMDRKGGCLVTSDTPCLLVLIEIGKLG